MKSMVNLRALKINSHDPRLSKAFLLLSSELSHLNGALSGATDWKMLEDKCFQLFRDYGYDLQNGVWFCLINMQLKSWAGLAEGLDLLTTAFTHNNVRCWPPVAAVQARQSLIDWFCANVATHIYTLKYGPENNGEMRSVERSIGVLYEYSKNLQSRSHDSLKNLHYFLQVRCRSVPYPVQKVVAKTPSTVSAVKPLIVKPPIEKPEPLPEPILMPEMALAVPAQRPLLWALGGMAAGLGLSLAVAAGWYTLQTPSLSEKLVASVAQLEQGGIQAASVWHDVPPEKIQQQKQAILQQAGATLNWLSTQPADALVGRGERLSDLLQQHFPNNEVSAQWLTALKEKAGSIPALDGYIKANKHLDELDARLLNAEKTQSKYMTVSELKTAVYQIRQDLQSNGAAAETLLWEIQQTGPEKRDPAVMKKIEQRIEALNSRYLLLKEK
ncbi:type VI secretion system ImpA family N-terminal domain-containing protein [Buttiauxella sp. A2-C2_NF]|uniref:VasL domain-containing protein n=1 Tax=Buttiauxella ferragutiae TaxID=82989 RepID=UPI001E63502A|nr:VasL domain-containing protein [Buttiauxella ferragutiae]MCE0826813.1 type VI secretion system ImpA family N-terminal domain-containing protein [Buttiauxella ferragutiae]